MLSPRRSSAANPLAVIDIGSNSGRVMVFERDRASHLRLLAGSRAPLRLVHDVDTRQQLTEETMARTLDALRDFQAIANSVGARKIVAVATAAMRDATNGARFTDRVRRELGIRIEIIGGLKEARYGFAGAIRGLAVSNGLLFDVGGGSMQVTRFSNRQMGSAVSLPFGALRTSERFLKSDPPSGKQLRRLREHVQERLAKARAGRLASSDQLVGTGGTLRNLAKIDRESRRYPIRSLHGYELSIDRLGEVVDRLASTKRKRRDEIPGLSADRADSIVGGAVVIQALADFVRAKSILVSGQGVREGVALEQLRLPVGSPDAVKQASLASLVSRFDGWRAEAAARRRTVAAALQQALEPRAPDPVARALDGAALVMDVGRTLDVGDRHEHVADILLSTDLTGFTHQELALMAALVRRAGDRHADVLSMAPVRRTVDAALLDRAAILLALADEVEARCPHGSRIAVHCEIGRHVILTIRALPSWLVRDLDKRFERAFGRPLVVRHG
jgi:exopolyphosphatase/guanosine-5'-triphosphate,3'-diphosphate pyrophosphatase